MKSTVFFILLVIASLCNAQTSIEKEFIVEAKGMTADDIYQHARLWVAETFANEQHSIAVDDKANHILTGNGSLKFTAPRVFGYMYIDGHIFFKYSIQTKDNRLKVKFYSYTHEGLDTSYGIIPDEDPAALKRDRGGNKKVWSALIDDSKNNNTQLAESIHKHFNQALHADNNW